MNNFVFNGTVFTNDVVNDCDKTTCQNNFFGCKSSSDTREFNTGKSFRCNEWNAETTFYNDEFIQDFVIYDNSLYVCIKTNTNVIPHDKWYWKLVVTGIKGEKGDSGPGNFRIDTVDPNYNGTIGEIYLNITTGEFFEYNRKWISCGNISVESTQDLSWIEYE